MTESIHVIAEIIITCLKTPTAGHPVNKLNKEIITILTTKL